jgi:hypothetical protein
MLQRTLVITKIQFAERFIVQERIAIPEGGAMAGQWAMIDGKFQKLPVARAPRPPADPGS